MHDQPTLTAVLDLLAGKWSVPVLTALSQGTRRFHELAAMLDGVSRRMLSMTLRRLERDGLIERHVYARIPARVEYQLSEVGETLVAALFPVAEWGDENLEAVHAARERYERHLAFRRGLAGDADWPDMSDPADIDPEGSG